MTELFYRFGTALAIGFLVGLQREYSFDDDAEQALFAGVRTFSLIGLLGAAAAFAADVSESPSVLVAVLVLVGLLILCAYAITGFKGDVGMTTEVAAVMTLITGVLCYHGQLGLAVALGVAITVLLSAKMQLRRLAERITREDVIATLKFGVITAIILPVLPREGIGAPPFDVVKPYNVWLMVVLISGLGFLGYVLMKVVGAQHGIGLTGLLGGLVSSTAVTLTFSQRSKEESSLARPFAVAITVAWTVMFGRVLVEVAVVNRSLLRDLWLPMAAACVVGLAYCTVLYFTQRTTERQDVDFANPFELGPAVTFGLLYGVILLVSRAAQIYLGTEGIYASAVLAGLTDVDAITLSMAELSQEGGSLATDVAARAVVLAAISNTVIKGGIVLSTGDKSLRRTMLPGFLLMVLTALGTAFLI